MSKEFFLQQVTCEFSSGPNGDMSLNEFLFFLNRYYKGIQAERDYVVNIPSFKACYYVTGIGRLGALAVASVAKNHRLKVVRLDIRFEFIDDKTNGKAEHSRVKHLLDGWFSKHKPLTTVESVDQDIDNGLAGKRSIYGTRSAPIQTFIFDTVKDWSGLAIEFRLRADWAKNGWSYFEECTDEIEFDIAAESCFAAVQNTYYGPDFFGLALDRDVRVTRTSKRPLERDYWTYVSSVAHKIIKECEKQQSALVAEETLKQLQEQIAKGLTKAFQ